MKQFKLTFVLTILLSMVGLQVFAAWDTSTKEQVKGLYYYLDKANNFAQVTSRSSGKYTGNITIPSTFNYQGNTYSVTSIGYSAFSGCSGLTSITIGNSVTLIGSYAFSGCSGLTSIEIPNSVTSIENNAFNKCYFEKQNFINNSRLDEEFNNYWGATIVDSKENGFIIKDGTLLKYNGNDSSITIPNSVTSIGSSAFYNCSGLTSIEIPNSVTSIGNEAFRGCSSLTSITIPNSVTSIGNSAFYNCSSLTSITIPNSVTSIGESVFYGCSGLASIKIPNSVTSIGNSAFYNCSGLTSIEIPNSVTSIEDNAFRGCSSLTSITIPNSVTSIGGSAFSDCRGLTSITIPNSVTSIGGTAFYGCSGLASIEIPNSVISVGQFAFAGCSKLTSVDIKDVAAWCNIMFSDDSSNPLYYAKHLFMSGKEITDLVIPDTVTSIGNYTFYNCSGLKSVTIGNNVTSIGNFAFCNCSGLTSITIPNNVTSIGNYAFNNCSGLTSVTIPNSMTSIGGGAFYDCSKLTEVYCNAENVPTTSTNAFYNASISSATLYLPAASVAAYMAVDPWSKFGTVKTQGGSEIYNGSCGDNVRYSLDTGTGVLSITGTGAMTNYSSSSNVPWYNKKSYIKTVEIINGITSIGNYAFDNCDSLESVTIPNSVTSIGDGAFHGCSGLEFVTIPNSVKSIGNYAFSGCTGELIVNCNIPSSTSAMESVFYDSKFKSVKIGEDVTSIGDYAFYNCDSLVSVTIGNSVTSIGSSAFSSCSSLTSVHITDIAAWFKINFSGDYSNPLHSAHHLFMNGKEIKELIIPNSVTSIEDGAFYSCFGLTSVTIGNSVTSIGKAAFDSCTGLTSVTIPNSVTSIGDRAFSYCLGLTEVYCNAENVPNTSATAFDHTNISNATLIVSTSSFDAYKAAKPWNNFGIVKAILNGSCGENVNFTLDPETGVLSITGTGAMTNYSSSSDVPWCSYKSYIKTVEIADGVTSIGNYAFYGCTGLEHVTIPNSVTSIGGSAFYGCSGLTSIEIPSSVTSIGNSAFYNCTGLTSVTIPNSVTSIGGDAFSGCSGLKEVYCNAENVPTTSTDAFNNINIANATLYVPAASVAAYMAVDPWSKFGNVKTQDGSIIYHGSCGENAWYSLNTGTGVFSITGTGAMTNYSSSSNVPWYSYKSYIKSIEISDDITSIGNYAFYNCDSIESITIPNSVTSIGNYTFYNCSGFTSIEISSSVTSIGSSAFSGCAGELIVNCKIPSASQSTNGAFYGSKFKSVTIGESVTSIGDYAFNKCDSLTSIVVESENTKYDSRNNCNTIVETATNTLIAGCKNTIIPNSVTSIGKCAFYNCSGLTSITIPNSVTTIGSSAFDGCSALTSVEIPNSVTSIGDYAFMYCSGLTKVTLNSNAIASKAYSSSSTIGNIFGSQVKEYIIGEKVTSIGDYAFYNCDSLTSVTIPNRVSSIGGSAFYNCSGLTEVYCNAENVPTTSTDAFNNANIANASLFVPATSVAAYMAVEPWSKFGTVITQDGSIIFHGSCGDNAWYSLDTGTGVLSITGTGAMTNYSSSSNVPWYSYKSYIKSIEMSDEIISIGDYAFYDCDSLVSVTVPNSVTSIGSSAFSSCEALTRVSINSNSIVSTGDYSLCSIFGSQVKEYVIGKDVTSIWAGKFCDCTDLAFITIPTSVKSIGNSAFRNCPNLESVVIPNSVTSIGDYALSDCANLKSVTIGSGVQVIGKDVFENHHPSKVFWLTNTPPEGYAYAEGSINYVSNTRYTEFSNVIRYSSLSSIFEVDGIRYVPVNPSARTCDAIDCTYDEYIDSINIGEKVTYRGIALSVKQVSPYTCYENKYIKDINLSFKGDIGAKAFYGCSNMITAELGNGILSIGESGFSSCSKLESIVIPDSVVAINDSTFCDCIVLNSAKIGRGVESIGRYAFSGCSVLPNIRIPRSVTSVADYAFRGCENIKTVVMEDGNSELSLSSNGSNPLFVDCPLDSVYIGRNIFYETSAEYGYSPFYHNETLRTVVITDNETEISDNEFYSCTNLQSFKIGDGVTRFGNWAFSGCSSLKTLGFGTELQSIGQEAFSDCSAVTVIVSRTEIPPVCESQALEDINKWECTLYVPEGTSPDYQEADQWKDFWYMEEGAPYVVIRGDVNGDEFVNMKDAIFVTNIILGLEDATEAADVNNDGKINIQDVMFIVNYIKNGTFPDE